LALEAPEGRGMAVGFAPDLSNPDLRYDAGSARNIIWFRPVDDPHCRDNTSGPVTSSDQGGAVWQQPISRRTPIVEGSFQGWPVRRGTYISQDFGCTDFPEIAGYDCPASRPWFHAGVDFAARKGSPLYAVTEGTITFVGVSQGVRCRFPGAEEPRTNLGWVIVLQSGPYTIKYGHTIVGSERVQAGDRVSLGQVLALMGSTGCSTGPHLHFQVQRPGQGFVDPFNLLGLNGGSNGNGP
jgi:murein DD-endopeptidase MepM/ murein hydrolase activator NlpD